MGLIIRDWYLKGHENPVSLPPLPLLEGIHATDTREFSIISDWEFSYICAHVPMSLRARTSVPGDWLVIKVSESDTDLW